MTSRALVAVLVACGLGAAACGGAAGGAVSAAPAPQGGPDSHTAPPASPPAAPVASPAAGESRTALPLSGKVVVVDPGHNGQNYRHPSAINKKVNVLTQWKACDTTGTVTPGGYTEAAFTWDVSRRLVKILKSRGATVKLTRPDNAGVGPCITERAAIGNRAKADAAVSVHADGSAPANHGFHVIMPKRINGPVDPVVNASRRLGLAVRDAYRAGTGVPYSTYIGTRALSFRSDLGGLNLSRVPKIFIECGNMKNPGDAGRFQDAAFRQKAALALADGLQSYLG